MRIAECGMNELGKSEIHNPKSEIGADYAVWKEEKKKKD